LEHEVIGERITAAPADESFLRWVGEYTYSAGGIDVAVTVSIDDNGFAIFNQAGMAFLLDRIDEYTYFFPGGLRMSGTVLEFSMDGDVAVMRYSDQLLRRTDGAPSAADAAIDLRFVIGNTEFSHNNTTRQMDSAPFIDTAYNRTMVPLRVIAEIFGAEVGWVSQTRAATIEFGGMNLVISVDEPLPNEMGVAHNVEGRIFVPIAYIIDAFGAEIRWDGATQTVYVLG
jgi:hypothetical protein